MISAGDRTLAGTIPSTVVRGIDPANRYKVETQLATKRLKRARSGSARPVSLWTIQATGNSGSMMTESSSQAYAVRMKDPIRSPLANPASGLDSLALLLLRTRARFLADAGS